MSVKIFDSASQAYAEPQSVPKRYDAESSAYVETTGNAYDPDAEAWEEKWSPNKILYLYNNGDECTDVTGGLGYAKLRTSSVASATKNLNNIHVSSTGRSGNYYSPMHVFTNNAIDVTNYNKLCAKYKNIALSRNSNNTPSSFVGVLIPDSKPATVQSGYSYNEVKISFTGNGSGFSNAGNQSDLVIEMDISDISGSFFLTAIISAYDYENTDITLTADLVEFWLE